MTILKMHRPRQHRTLSLVATAGILAVGLAGCGGSNFLQMVGLQSHRDRYPNELSGGQRQRVALVRALAVAPSVLLLDEPFSALDARIRQDLRAELRRIQTDTGVTAVFVTHDQEEALAISDRVALMRHGRIEQLGTPAQVYENPSSGFAASFIGTSTALDGQVTGPARITLEFGNIDVEYDSTHWKHTGRVKVMVRPESVRLIPAANGLAKVTALSFVGTHVRVTASTPDGCSVEALVGSALRDSLPLGCQVDVGITGKGLYVGKPDEVVEG